MATASVPRARSGDAIHLLILGLGLAVIILAAETGSEAGLLLAVTMFCSVLIAFAAVAASRNADVSFFLLVPSVMSAFQNVYLSPFAHEIPQSALQVVIITNFIYSLLLLFTLAGIRTTGFDPRQQRAARVTLGVLVVIVLFGTALMLVSGNNIVGALASARNLVAPMLFFLLGYYATAFVDFHYYLRLVVSLGWVVLAFALVEYLVPDFWPAIGLHHLWELKGIAVTENSLLPRNFYASEQIEAGTFIRRMAGPFADPVNFGTFLFALLMVAWFLRSRVLFLASIVASVLVVSKGALLGLLAFGTVWARKFRSAFEFVLVGVVTVAAGLYFYAFTQSSSTGSTTAHINGLIAAFVELPRHPLGRGFGGTGVLAGLFADEAAEGGSAIVESGLGSVIGQLGIPGLIGYIVFFAMIIRSVHRIQDVRVYVLGMSLALAFILNAAFNEVALSPNSCAIYFIVLGLIVASSDEARGGGAAGARALAFPSSVR